MDIHDELGHLLFDQLSIEPNLISEIRFGTPRARLYFVDRCRRWVKEISDHSEIPKSKNDVPNDKDSSIRKVIHSYTFTPTSDCSGRSPITGIST